jgi:hypothetical protein
LPNVQTLNLKASYQGRPWTRPEKLTLKEERQGFLSPSSLEDYIQANMVSLDERKRGGAREKE